jgi:hypothetical protein
MLTFLTEQLSKRMKQMELVYTNLEAIGIAEGFFPCEDDERYWAAWQHIIDKRLDVALQGWFADTTKVLIELGKCRPAPEFRP